ncbi:MAG TPA: ABC transporter permease [Actinomycetes bacterium]|nr:ABC transporter permease [Actinomycetes bacterium]
MRWVRSHLVQFFAALVLFYMFVPVLLVVIFSFNLPSGKFNYIWNQFSTQAWVNVWQDPLITDSVVLSLEIAFVATAVATLLGTLIAFAIGRHRFVGRAGTNLLIFMPMATPEVVMGSSLLTLFVAAGLEASLGRGTIMVAHIMFCISFVVVTVKARIAGLDSRLEQAAMDLYADEKTTFWKVTFPLVLPGIVAAALLAFSLSFDDFVITNFTSGQTVTFPMYVWGAAGRGIPPEANVVGAIMFGVAVLVVLLPQLLRRRRAKTPDGPKPEVLGVDGDDHMSLGATARFEHS